MSDYPLLNMPVKAVPKKDYHNTIVFWDLVDAKGGELLRKLSEGFTLRMVAGHINQVGVLQKRNEELERVIMEFLGDAFLPPEESNNG